MNPEIDMVLSVRENPEKNSIAYNQLFERNVIK